MYGLCLVALYILNHFILHHLTPFPAIKGSLYPFSMDDDSITRIYCDVDELYKDNQVIMAGLWQSDGTIGTNLAVILL
jgi:hypothetical protein